METRRKTLSFLLVMFFLSVWGNGGKVIWRIYFKPHPFSQVIFVNALNVMRQSPKWLCLLCFVISISIHQLRHQSPIEDK